MCQHNIKIIIKPRWWDNNPADKRLQSLTNGVDRFFDHLDQNEQIGKNHGWKNVGLMKQQLKSALSTANKNVQSGDCKGAFSNRRRRETEDDEDDEDFIVDGIARKKSYNKGLKKEGKNFFRNIARWVKFELYDTGAPKCQHKATRLVRSSPSLLLMSHNES